jgi:hypothetical protein
MEEFTSIAIWLLIAIMAINTTIVWFANQPTFMDETLGLSVPNVTDNSNFVTSDVNALKNAYYTPKLECSTVVITDQDYGPCVLQTIGDIFSPITGAVGAVASGVGTVGAFVQDVWNFAFAWAYLLDSITIGIPGAELFANLIKGLIFVIEIAAIVVLVLKVAGIIRGGS